MRYLRTECHLAENSVQAYERDMARFFQWLGKRRLQEMTVSELAGYSGWLAEQSLAPASVSRHLASLKVFFRFLQLEGVLKDNQAELLTSQKLWQRIPQVLSAGEVDDLLTAPKPFDGLWRRDRALLEMLYATGCRVSELANLRLRDLHLEERYAQCRGKGDKQRMTPLGTRAVEAIETYLREEREELAAKKTPPEPYLFLSSRGRRLSRGEDLGTAEALRRASRGAGRD